MSWCGGGWQVGRCGTPPCIAMGLTQQQKTSVRACCPDCLCFRWKGGWRFGMGFEQRPDTLSCWRQTGTEAITHAGMVKDIHEPKSLSPSELVNSRQPCVQAPHKNVHLSKPQFLTCEKLQSNWTTFADVQKWYSINSICSLCFSHKLAERISVKKAMSAKTHWMVWIQLKQFHIHPNCHRASRLLNLISFMFLRCTKAAQKGKQIPQI